MDVLVAAFDPGKHTKWDVETTRRHNCTAAAWTLVAGYVICSWSNMTGVDDGNNLSRNVAVPYLICYCFYVQLLFTTVFHDLCISRQKPFFLFNSLPNALFIITFPDVSGGICQISISICFSSFCTWAEVYRTLDTHHFGFEEQSTIIHTCWADAQCKKTKKL